MTEDKTILKEAEEIIYGDRAKEYGKAVKNFSDIATMWSVILGVPVTSNQVISCMIALKQCRLINQPGHRDSWMDIAGYVGCVDKIKRGE